MENTKKKTTEELRVEAERLLGDKLVARLDRLEERLRILEGGPAGLGSKKFEENTEKLRKENEVRAEYVFESRANTGPAVDALRVEEPDPERSFWEELVSSVEDEEIDIAALKAELVNAVEFNSKRIEGLDSRIRGIQKYAREEILRLRKENKSLRAAGIEKDERIKSGIYAESASRATRLITPITIFGVPLTEMDDGFIEAVRVAMVAEIERRARIDSDADVFEPASTDKLTQEERDVINHALGGPANFRNSYSATRGTPRYELLLNLVERGLFARGALGDYIDTFHVTERGRAAVGLHDPSSSDKRYERDPDSPTQ